jgi:hypothetical protein
VALWPWLVLLLSLSASPVVPICKYYGAGGSVSSQNGHGTITVWSRNDNGRARSYNRTRVREWGGGGRTYGF